jgi:hypothetical protein
MSERMLGRYRRLPAGAVWLAMMATVVAPSALAQTGSTDGTATPDLAGIWDGSPRSHPINGVNQPWTPDNFPVLNERALAYQGVFDEAIAQKYDCVPSTPPALQFDPYMTEIVQWPDRVLFRYEKDDVLRTAWLDGRQPNSTDYGLQGFSVGRYEGDALIVVTTHFVFDVSGFDDYNGIPSSQLKKVTERYWREGEELKLTLTVEDPLFLREPASYTTQFRPGPDGRKLSSYDCDPEAARQPVKFLVPRYK